MCGHAFSGQLVMEPLVLRTWIQFFASPSCSVPDKHLRERENSLMTLILCPREASAGNLQPLYEFVREALRPKDNGEAAWRCPVLLVDDLSVLLSLGMGAVAVLDFVHYCRATVCWKLQVSMGLPSVLLPRASQVPVGLLFVLLPEASQGPDRSRPHLLSVIFLV